MLGLQRSQVGLQGGGGLLGSRQLGLVRLALQGREGGEGRQ